MIPYKRNKLGIGTYKTKIPLKLEATQANSTVKLTKTGSPTVSGLLYKTNLMSGWSPYVIDYVITLENVGDYVQFWNTEETLSTSNNDYVKFTMSGKIAGSGNIMSLLNYIDSCKDSCFRNLFQGCSVLVSPPQLPSMNLATACYSSLFYNCTSLTKAPELPATTIADQCYAALFYNCPSLTKAPELPATIMKPACYQYMFATTSVQEAPALPATTLAAQCYSFMFQATPITKAPELPATTLESNCYWRMFAFCSNLEEAPYLPATTLSQGCYADMFRSSPKINKVSVGFTDWSNTSATTDWLTNTADTGTFICPSELTIPSRDGSGVPEGWNIVHPVEYLESTGTQWIDTGIKPDFTNGDKIEMSMFNPSGNLSHFGSRYYDTTYRNSIYNIGGYIVFYVGTGAGANLIWNDYSGEHVLIIDDTNIIDNGSILAPMPLQPKVELPIFLFTFNDNGQPHPTIASSMKLYGWKYWRNGELVQEFIPVLDNSNVPCMYDKVSGQCYYNQGTGQFNFIRRVSYLESTGTQYIDTGIKPDFAGGDSIEIGYYSASYEGVSPCAFGSRETGIRNGVYVLGSGMTICDNEDYSSLPVPSVPQNINIIINDNEVIENSTRIVMPRRVTCGLPIYLFALNNYGTSTFGIYNGMKLYYWKYYKNGILSQYLVPALYNNITPCMYDMISGSIVYNSGTGSFLYG